jgi:hypothetical protein
MLQSNQVQAVVSDIPDPAVQPWRHLSLDLLGVFRCEPGKRSHGSRSNTEALACHQGRSSPCVRPLGSRKQVADSRRVLCCE